MGRTVSAWVTSGSDHLGLVGPFPVGQPWWAEAEEIGAHLRRVLGTPVWVLRLLSVEGGEGGRDGHVTYHVEALARPVPWPPGEAGRAASRLAVRDVPPEVSRALRPHALRAAWATAEGLREALGWAEKALAAAGRPPTGPPEQRKTWNLAGLFRLPTAEGAVWLKTLPPFAADEAAVIGALAVVDPGLVPRVVAAGEGRVILDHLPGEDCWDASPATVTAMMDRFVAAQAALARAPERLTTLRDLRPPVLAERVRDLLDGETGRELTGEEEAAARRLAACLPLLEECGLPATLVHGDFHPGNWRGGDGIAPVALDFADAHFGDPALDGVRACDFLPADRREEAARAWAGAWRRHVPGCDPRRALEVAGSLAHLAYAVRYQEFLDGIEPSERIYHLGDPATSVRAALRRAAEASLI